MYQIEMVLQTVFMTIAFYSRSPNDENSEKKAAKNASTQRKHEERPLRQRPCMGELSS